MAKEIKQLYRSKTNKRLAGVCGGLATYFELDATLLRLVVVVITVLSGLFPGLLIYLLAALIMPEEPTA